jgi:hypothetical protein
LLSAIFSADSAAILDIVIVKPFGLMTASDEQGQQQRRQRLRELHGRSFEPFIAS